MYTARVDEYTARLRLWQDASLSADLDLDAIAGRHPGEDDVLTLVDLARSVRALAPALLTPSRRRA